MKKSATADEYLATLADAPREALERLRTQIKSVAKGAEEYFGYGLLGFKWQGHPLLYIGASKNHCAIYGARAEESLAAKLAGFKQSKGTIQFTPDKPIPASVIKAIVKARMEANAQRWGTSKQPTPSKAKRSPSAASKRKKQPTKAARVSRPT